MKLLVFCNKCMQLQQADIKFYFLQCRHILCENCLDSNCTICNLQLSSTNHMPIDKNMTPSVAVYFENPIALYRRFQKVTKFQLEQEALYADYCIRILPGLKKRKQAQLQGLIKLDESLKSELVKERQRVRKLKDYLAFHERQMEQPAIIKVQSFRRQSPPQSIRHFSMPYTDKEKALVYKSQNYYRMQTPTLSLGNSDISSVHSSVRSRNSGSESSRSNIIQRKFI